MIVRQLKEKSLHKLLKERPDKGFRGLLSYFLGTNSKLNERQQAISVLNRTVEFHEIYQVPFLLSDDLLEALAVWYESF